MGKKEKDGDTGKTHVISIYIFVHIHFVCCEHLLLMIFLIYQCFTQKKKKRKRKKKHNTICVGHHYGQNTQIA
jgi:hypothetical protein